MKIVAALKKGTLNVLVAVDQLINAAMFGDPDETISSRAGKLVSDKSRPGPAPLWARFTCAILEKLDPGHCAGAIESDEGKDSPL